MKKLFTFISVLSLSTLSYASVTMPVDQRNNQIMGIDFVGGLPCTISNVQGTNGAPACFAGKGEVLGYLMEGDLASNFVVLWDSGVASSTVTIPSSFTIITATGTFGSGGGTALVSVKFPVPIQFKNGLVGVPNGTVANNGMWTLIYRPLKAPTE